jgi:hypothetical protein
LWQAVSIRFTRNKCSGAHRYRKVLDRTRPYEDTAKSDISSALWRADTREFRTLRGYSCGSIHEISSMHCLESRLHPLWPAEQSFEG